MDHDTFVFDSIDNEVGIHQEEQNVLRSKVFTTMSEARIG